jgi:hypothetical protein
MPNLYLISTGEYSMEIDSRPALLSCYIVQAERHTDQIVRDAVAKLARLKNYDEEEIVVNKVGDPCYLPSVAEMTDMNSVDMF